MDVELLVHLRKSCWPKSRSWWPKCRLFVRPLTARVGIVVKLQRGGRGGGEVKYLSGSCSPFKNRKLVFRIRVYLSSSFLLQERWAKQQGKWASPGEREGIKAGCYDSTASMPLRSFGEAFYHRCSFARKMRRC